ncbi:MAG: InlB B-repeat-containing protein [Clostridia bacterium]|nr:InlB B-repeat-containing protein [Clostridia bacterium]
MYRKALKTILMALILSIVTLTFVACKQQTFTVSIYDGTEVVKTYDSLPLNSDLEDITKPGYKYVGAYYDKELTDEFDSQSFGKLNADLALYLKYEKRSLVVQVNSNGGSSVEPQTVEFNSSYSIPIPTREGYTFAGYMWNGEEFPTTGTYTETNSIKLFATWTINSYNVKFLNANDNNAQLGDTLTLEYNSKVTSIPSVPTGYEIENGKVYSDAACTQEVDLSTYKVTQNADLYVKVAAKKYTVTFNTNGGNAIDAMQIAYNAQYTLPAPTKVGYVFTGYTFNGAPFALNGTFENTSNITLFATYEVATYAVKFLDANNSNAQLGNTLTLTHNSTVALPQVEAGYEIANGKVYSDAACTQEVDLATYKVTQNADLYVKVTAKQFTIKINKNGGDDIQNVTVLYKGTYTLIANPTRTGYNFNGYVYNGQAFALTGTYNFTSDITIDATWEAEEGFNDRKVIFKDGENELTDYERDVELGDSVKANTLPVLTKTGYKFDGWFVDANLQTAFTDTVVAGDITLYAKFTAEVFTISVNANGGSAVAPIQVAYGTTYTLGTPTLTGYTFAGYTWNGVPFDTNAAFSKLDNITLFATWTINVYDVVFLSSENDGQLGNTLKLEYNSLISLAQLPEAQEGYELVGGTVYFDKACTQAVDLATYKVTDNISLYAKFAKKAFTIEIVTNGADGQPSRITVDVLFGEVPVISTLTKNGYKFIKFVEYGTSTTFNPNAEYVKATNVLIEVIWEKLEVEVGENSTDAQYNLFHPNGTEYFKEKAHYNEASEYTYVFFTGVNYNFTSADMTVSANTLVDVQNNAFTPSKTGEFELTITKVVDDTNVTYVRNAKVVERIASFVLNDTRNAENFNSKKLVDAMSVGKANGYKPDITIEGRNGVMGFSEGNVIITAKQAGSNDTIVIDTSEYNSATGFNLADLTDGATYTFTFTPKYYTGGNEVSAKDVKVTINNGVNVYTNDELRAAFANLEISEINVLRDIKAELTSNQYVDGNVHNPYHTLYNITTEKYQYNDGFISENSYNNDGSINTDVMKNGWVYSRSTVGANDSISINGNSFKLDATNLPRVNGGLANTWVTFAGMEPGTERVVNHHAFIFSYMSHAPNDMNTAVNNNNTFNIENLAIFGNNTELSDVTTTYGKGGESYYTMSASYNTLRIMGGNLNATNVAIRNSLIGFFISGDSDATTAGANGYATKSVLDDCYIDNNWANSICTFYLNHLTVKNSTIKSSGGAAIHFDCAPYPDATVQNSTLVLENTQISNWVTGEESWFTAYGMSIVAPRIKTSLNTGLLAQNFTCIKKEGKSEAFNFAIFYQQTGKATEWEETLLKIPYVIVKTLDDNNAPVDFTSLGTMLDPSVGKIDLLSENPTSFWVQLLTENSGVKIGTLMPIFPIM